MKNIKKQPIALLLAYPKMCSFGRSVWDGRSYDPDPITQKEVSSIPHNAKRGQK